MTINPRLAIYDVFFFDHTGAPVRLLDTYEYLELSQRVSDAWNYQIRINLAPEDTILLPFFRNTLVRDFIVEIYRTDPLTLDKDLVYEGFHRTLVDQIKQDGSVVLTLYGTGYTQILKRHIIIPAAGEENSNKSGPAETAMKAYVNDQCINPVDASRVIPGLSNEANANLGANAEYSARYTNLFTAVSRLAEQGSVDFGVIKGASVGTFIFRVRTLWGTDRRFGNSAGNLPTIFDVSLGNMLIPILSHRGSDEVNHAYVGGQGQGVSRVIREVFDAAARGMSPWNRHEAFVDARNEADTDGLDTRGRAYLEDHKSQTEFTFNVEQTEGTRWNRDWELGDLATARYAGLEFHKKIVQVNAIVSAGATGASRIENISVEMEDA